MKNKPNNSPEPKSGLEKAHEKWKKAQPDKIVGRNAETLQREEKVLITQWRNPDSRDRILNNMLPLRKLEDHDTAKDPYLSMKMRLDAAIGVDLDAHLDDYEARQDAEAQYDSILDAAVPGNNSNSEAEGPAGTLDGLSIEDVWGTLEKE